MTEQFGGSFTQQEAMSDDAIEAAVRVLRSGRLHRYNTAHGEQSETAALEREFAEYVGSKYCLAVSSGGYAIATALRALGVGPGDKVLSNAFTLAPVPGAIASIGAIPVFVGVTKSLTIDLEDLRSKINEANVLLLSHMRGHICDMDALMNMCRDANVFVVEDCAHTMGAYWKDVPSGRHGIIGCYSTQTYKHINSGEGGLVVTDDPDLAAKCVLLSGSYMLYDRHEAAPSEDYFQSLKTEMPNISGRMDNLRAAILRPQLVALDEQVERWNSRYRVLESTFRAVPEITVVERPNEERIVGSSIQFLLLDWRGEDIRRVVSGCSKRGVELKWFGDPQPKGYTSRYTHWSYAPTLSMPESDRILDSVLDVRIPLTFSLNDCEKIGRIIVDEVASCAKERRDR